MTDETPNTDWTQHHRYIVHFVHPHDVHTTTVITDRERSEEYIIDKAKEFYDPAITEGAQEIIVEVDA
jgi:hypothetical protein